MKNTLGQSPLFLITCLGTCMASLGLLFSPALAQVNGPGPSPSSAFDNILNLPGDEETITGVEFESIGAVQGQTTQLNVSDNGFVGSVFNANSGSEVNVNGGTLSYSFRANSGSEVNISGGTVLDDFQASSGSVVNITGGTVGDFIPGIGTFALFSANSGSVVNIGGGTIGDAFTAAAGSEVNISGGSIGNDFNARFGSTVSIEGSAFSIDGSPLNTLQVGQTMIITDREVTLSGVLADGEPFSFDLNVAESFGLDFFSPDASLSVTLSAALLLGDINRDGVVDFFDISPFIMLLSNGGFQAEGDINQDGVVDFFDISPFIGILASL